MGMDTNVIGIKPPDKKWKAMKEIYDKCLELKILIPKEVSDYFGDEDPDPSGVLVEIPYEDYSAEDIEGIEIEVSKIPKDVKIIRFYNSW